jgi:AMP nucleosidase
MRGDHLLDEALPPSVPITPSFLINRYLAKVLDDSGFPYRIGAVYTTGDRNWELALRRTMMDLRASRSIAVDMESATVAANGFRYRIPHATLLCVSDKPLHGQPKLSDEARSFYEDTKKQHIAIATTAMEQIKQEYRDGLPNIDIRAPEEPLLGGPDD